MRRIGDGRSGGLSAVAARAFAVLGLLAGATLPAARSQAPAVAAKPGPASPERSSARSRLVVQKVGTGASARTVVALGKPTAPTALDDLRGTDQGILARELIRQALLIAARDELGLATRDEVLDDVPPPGGSGQAAEVASFFPDAGESQVRFRRAGGGAGDVLLRDAGLEPSTAGFLPKLVERAERLSRDGFPAALKGLGLSSKPNKVQAGAALPPKSEERLAGLGFVDNLAAVRDLHAAIRNDGESPERIGALARGYAYLGVLSEYHWSPAHKAFKARALLYAQRLAAREPNSALALRTRAFVRALVGRPRDALDDLAEAKKRPGAAAAPGWVGPIEAYCQADRKGMEAKGGAHAGLSALLRMMEADYPLYSSRAIEAAKGVLAVDPECYRAYDTLCRHGGVSVQHVATEAGPEMLTRSFPAKLKALGGVPTAVMTAAERRSSEPALVAALARAGAPADDAGEPSWGVLAHLARETRFAQVARRMFFMRVVWSVPVDEYWAEARPLVAGHRFLPYLEYLALPPQQGIRVLSAFADRIDPTELEYSATFMLGTISRNRIPREALLNKNGLDHVDDCAQDLAMKVEAVIDEHKPGIARTLLDVSPRSAFAMGTLVDNDWDAAKGLVPSWEKEVGEAPPLLAALGRRYTALKQYDKADAYLSRYIKQSPDHWAYKMLAANYKEQGQVDRWKATLDEFLAKVEDRGLDHAKVQVEIARHFMAQKKWAEARPYAEAAAETWSSWGMMCAADCAEGSGDWERAELLTRQTSERYPSNNWKWWYLFCARTGHGDAEAARAWTVAYLTAVEGRPDLAEPDSAAYFYWLIGDLKKAQEIFGRLYQKDHRIATAVDLALIADEQGDAKRRDELLKEAREASGNSTQGLVYSFMRDILAQPNAPFPVANFERWIEQFAPNPRGNLYFRVGTFLLKQGKAEDGRAYLKRSADGEAYYWLKIMAIDRLRKIDAKKAP